MNIDDLAARLREFARERDWEQFHEQQSQELSPAVKEQVAAELE